MYPSFKDNDPQGCILHTILILYQLYILHQLYLPYTHMYSKLQSKTSPILVGRVIYGDLTNIIMLAESACCMECCISYMDWGFNVRFLTYCTNCTYRKYILYICTVWCKVCTTSPILADRVIYGAWMLHLQMLECKLSQYVAWNVVHLYLLFPVQHTIRHNVVDIGCWI